jgi:mycothiol synthase
MDNQSSPHPAWPDAYRLRTPARADAGAVAALRQAVEVARDGTSDVSVESVLAEWGLPGFSLADDAWLVEDHVGTATGYGLCCVEEPPAGIVAEQVVHPAHRGKGLSRLLLGVCEERAAEMVAVANPAGHGSLGVWTHESDRRRVALFERRGFGQTGSFLRLERDLGDRLEHPEWPQGVRIASFRRGVDETAVHAAYEEGFLDDPGGAAGDFDEWVTSRFGTADPDFGLWLVAWDGDEVVGGIESTETSAGGYMGELFVRPPWRGRGLGRALMLQEIVELARRGVKNAYFAVDAANTRALHLFGSLGFRSSRGATLFFEKRVGADQSGPGAP